MASLTMPHFVMSAPLWHHYVPRMYLKAWCDPKEKDRVLWVYKQGLKPKRKGAKAVAAEHGFYLTPEVSGAENEAEKAFADIEAVASKHLEDLRAGKLLTGVDRDEFALFIGLTKTRTRYMRQMMASTAVEIMRQGFEKTLKDGKVVELMATVEKDGGKTLGKSVEEVEEIFRKVAEGEVELTQSNKAWSVREALERGEKLGKIFAKASWGLFEAPGTEAFITSDNPVHIADPVAKAGGPRGFKFTKALQFVFPISPRYLVIGDFRNKGNGTLKVDAEKVHYFNMRHLEEAHEQVYASFCSQPLQVALEETFKGRAPLIQKPPPGMLHR